MKLSRQIQPISHLKAHAAGIVRNPGEKREPLVITHNGEAVDAGIAGLERTEAVAGATDA